MADCSINMLARTTASVDGYQGKILWDTSKPSDVYRINMISWKPKIDLETGLKDTYEWFLNNYSTIKSWYY